MNHLYITLISVSVLFSSFQTVRSHELTPKRTSISAQVLQDKIKGGWAGQVIGCTYGGPTEFRYPGTMIQDYVPISWDSTRVAWYFQHSPGLYDDVYMDLTFMEVMDKEGIDAPVNSHALAFANASYPLWHANQAARYNILNGIMPPLSGNWKYNPHSEDIDFQIEADFAGLMCPGMPNSASEICDRIGHIMNYGDGWYGGVYMAAMYSLAFVSRDVEYVVTEGLKAIPQSSAFYRCIQEVIAAYKKNPNDWKSAWFLVERNHAADIGCPEGIFETYNIDAKVNAAYVCIGLLYGKGDFARTLDIATRCGQDSDCNPASAGGILGTILGYSAIPSTWVCALKLIADKSFAYTNLSLNKVYTTGYKQALEMVRKGGGKVEGNQILLPDQLIKPVKSEVGFPGMMPVERRHIRLDLTTETDILFNGTGFVLTGQPSRMDNSNKPDAYVYQVEMTIDKNPSEKINLPVNSRVRRLEIAWKYDLVPGSHTVHLKVLNPRSGESVRINDLIAY